MNKKTMDEEEAKINALMMEEWAKKTGNKINEDFAEKWGKGKKATKKAKKEKK